MAQQHAVVLLCSGLSKRSLDEIVREKQSTRAAYSSARTGCEILAVKFNISQH